MESKAKIISFQFREKPEAIELERNSICRCVLDFVEVDFVCALDGTIDWNKPEHIIAGYSGVIFGGSGDFDFDGGRSVHDYARKTSEEILERLKPLLTYIFEHDIPTLGICFGHQLIGAFAGATVTHDKAQEKTCSHCVTLLVDDERHVLFSNLPKTFMAHYQHKDALDRIPEGAKLLANGGDGCKYSVLQYKNNIHTTQFHPELDLDDIHSRAKVIPNYLPEDVQVEDIFSQDISSNFILHNFAKFVAGY
jgi:GMP synthase-like glutamine amidotransferase